MLSRLTIRSRVFLLGGIPLACLLFVLIASIWVADTKDRYFHQLYDDHLAVLADVMAAQHLLQQDALAPIRQYRTGWASAESTREQVDAYLQQAAEHWQAFSNIRPTSVASDNDVYLELDEGFAAAMQKYQQWLAYAGSDALEVRILNESTVNAEIDQYINHFGALVDAYVQQQITTATLVRDSADALTQEISWVYLIGGSALLVLISAFIWATQRSIRRPLEHLRQTLVTVAAGSDLRLRADSTGRDEIADAAKALNTMLSHMQQLIHGLAEGSSALNEQAAQVKNSSDYIRTGTHTQSNQTDSLATAIEQMTVAIRQVAAHAGQGADMASNAEQLSNTGQDIVRRNMLTIQDLAEQVTQGAAVVTKLQQDSNQISHVLEVIQKISEQTNLLALNAAIEAARAGDAGRGFSVVADEVRALSADTNQATNSIREMIEQLQQQASTAVQAMLSAQDQTQQSVILAKDSEQHFEDIRSAIGSISEVTQLIFMATDEQQQVATAIGENIHQLNHEVAQLSTAATAAASASTELNQQAEQLEIGWQQFKA